MREVTLEEMLSAREERWYRQEKCISRFKATIISFTMNIPGPVKDSPLIRRAFETGYEMLAERLKNQNVSILYSEEKRNWTGCEALLAVDEDALEIKKICTSIEDKIPMGRLFDMDVIDKWGNKLNRQQVKGGPRDCIVCGAQGRGCASRRIHTVEELYGAAVKLMEEHFALSDRKKVAALVTKSLMEEICTTPKPGLVDCNNNGSHRDMNLFTFISSISSLIPYWEKCVEIGQKTEKASPEDTFYVLRNAGKEAEHAMFHATKGVNTNKGAIFTLGILCGALGRVWKAYEPYGDLEKILEECGKIAAAAMRTDFDHDNPHAIPETAGKRLYFQYGIKGIRGEVADGLPSVKNIALPVLKQEILKGSSRNDAGVITLLYLIAQGKDTNMISRGGMELAKSAIYKVKELIKNENRPSMEDVRSLDEWFMKNNLSPGGCADLLSVTYFLYDLEMESW